MLRSWPQILAGGREFDRLGTSPGFAPGRNFRGFCAGALLEPSARDVSWIGTTRRRRRELVAKRRPSIPSIRVYGC